MNAQRRSRVVVGVSRSLAGLQALRYGVAESRHRQVPLYAIRAWRFQAPWIGPDLREWRTEIGAEARRYVYEAFDLAMGGIPADVDVAVVAPEGRADLLLTGYAGYPEDLLVLGSSGRWRRNWLIRGCHRQAACPVTVVPPPEFARSGGPAVQTRRLLREAARLTDAIR